MDGYIQEEPQREPQREPQPVGAGSIEQQPVCADSIEISLVPERPDVERGVVRPPPTLASCMTAPCKGVFCLTGFLVLFSCMVIGLAVVNSKLDQVRNQLSATEDVRRRMNKILFEQRQLVDKHESILLEVERSIGLIAKSTKQVVLLEKVKVEYQLLNNTCVSPLNECVKKTETAVMELQKTKADLTTNWKTCENIPSSVRTIEANHKNLTEDQLEILNIQRTMQGLLRAIACGNDVKGRMSCKPK
ncbi:uncharacterized protein LOC133632142 [Entelurus aequoreus]|uniref:uncharacterized protein LOC133632140 n=1 Tax=Entelurus aequoreus TaxID=161455 RepID=UPI002B1DAC44|nr:uncharacterized protein LOC133632140 [Entelurus aequoreus]XP_061880369.1 uncharacterized protein LOC133632142 [Entelurus aequoreus]